MAENSGFFNASKTGESYDKSYDASDFARYFAKLIGNGVFVDPADQLRVSAKNGLTVTVNAGSAFIDGYWYELDEDKEFTFAPNATSYPITSLIVCGLNKSERKISTYVRDAVSSIDPKRDSNITELVLCSAVIDVGSSTITDANITDQRPFDQYCGFVAGAVEQIKTGELFSQFTDAFNTWFDSIKGKLGDDPATALQEQIDELAGSMQTIRSGTQDPSNSVGKDGDVYIKIVDS